MSSFKNASYGCIIKNNFTEVVVNFIELSNRISVAALWLRDTLPAFNAAKEPAESMIAPDPKCAEMLGAAQAGATLGQVSAARCCR